MSIYVTYRDLSEESFHNVTGYSNDGQVVRFSAIDSQGNEVSYELSWSEIRKVAKVGS